MDDDYDSSDSGELFNDDFDDNETTLRAGVRTHECPNCKVSLDYRVEGRFVVRTCPECKYEEED